MLRFIKNWTLPLAMLMGVFAYFVYAGCEWVSPLKPCVRTVVAWLTPSLIFAQLLLTFCKVEVKDLSPRRWSVWLLSIQLVSFLALAAVLLWVPVTENVHIAV